MMRKVAKSITFAFKQNNKLCTSRQISYGVHIGNQQNDLKGQYNSGQLFIHKKLGYRGVVLYPCQAKIYDDRDISVTPDGSLDVIKLPAEEIYYQVLVDLEDTSMEGAGNEECIFMAQKGELKPQILNGFGFVAHEDMLPYTSTVSDWPVEHAEFENFFTYNFKEVPNCRPRAHLNNWKKKCKMHLQEPLNVYVACTHGIKVTVMPSLVDVIPILDDQNKYIWVYCIRIENTNKEQVQLRSRHWHISGGPNQTVNGKGVVGQEPILNMNRPTFQYRSYVELHTSNGYMWGAYTMEKKNGDMIKVKIPVFLLRTHDFLETN
ncbi:polymerase delta-interacting protein 2 [Lingula anatina]|uniref:Polymerase delta-interacting protein 2 n=1 Tax=Lingula anatina TaxID=7574 RepID=A0A1S3IQI8_LINAN|nr:polymerase delta-interacting protein 2 [Lingula anatina]|eukprot:XP_013400176.1 polymerase delta-interacting protein 2 [Lingula anatina]